jgi:hypothetical protein
LHGPDHRGDGRRFVLDFRQRFGGLRRECLNFLRDNRKAAASLARSRRFNGGIERQQVGLVGDRRNHGGDLIDILDGGHQRASVVDGVPSTCRSLSHDYGCIGDLAVDLANRGRQLLNGGGDPGGVGRGLFGYRGRQTCVSFRFRQDRGHAACAGLQLRHQRIESGEIVEPLQTKPIGRDREKAQSTDEEGHLCRDWNLD